MKTLHIYSNRHIKDKVKTIKKGDWIYLGNGFSKKRWQLYFRGNNINEEALNITYITQEEFFELKNITFDSIVGNPPYTKGRQLLYVKFFEKALHISNVVTFVMPVQLESKHDKLKFHNQRIQKHLVEMGPNISDYFSVGYDNIHCVTASKSVINEVHEIEDPINSMPLLHPDRNRLQPIKGDTDIAIGDEVNGGKKTIYKVHKNDNVLFRNVEPYKVEKSSKKSKANFLVIVNHTPSKGKFNCVVLPNEGLCWSMWTFAFECNTQEEADKLKTWLQSDIIVEEIKKMLLVRNNQHTISKALIKRLPYYE